MWIENSITLFDNVCSPKSLFLVMCVCMLCMLCWFALHGEEDVWEIECLCMLACDVTGETAVMCKHH